MVSDVLMAIRPQFADRILSGSKQYEVRRSRPGFRKGSTVWIYATKPCGAVIGLFEAGEIVEASSAGLWRALGPRLGVTRAELEQYLVGKDRAFAIKVLRPRRLDASVDLPRGVVVPQSYRYLRREADGDDALARLLHAVGPSGTLPPAGSKIRRDGYARSHATSLVSALQASFTLLRSSTSAVRRVVSW